MRTVTYDKLRVQIFDTIEQLAAAAADDLSAVLRQAIAERGEASAIFATGNSQLIFYDQLCARDDIAWDRVTVFHMDEYLGLPEQHPASFRRYMRERLVERVRPRAFYGIAGDAPDVARELERYAGLIAAHRPVACVMGIGENGHLAFNDPPADLETDEPYLLVTLDEASRRQQLGEGWFPSIESVPREAISMSIRQILSADTIVCTVPDQRKAEAVRAAVEGPITSEVPASVLQRHPRCHLFLDRASASLLSSAVAS